MGLNRNANPPQDRLGIARTLSRDDIIGIPMHEQNGRLVAQFAGQSMRREEGTGEGEYSTWRGGTAKAHEQRHHGTLAEASQGITVGRQPKARKLRVDEPIEVGSRSTDPSFHNGGGPVCHAPPLAAEAGIM